MSGRRILKLVVFILFVVVVASSGGCKHSQPEGLVFVGGGTFERERSGRRNVVVVTHGWIEEGRGGWVEDTAAAIQKRVGASEWLCGYFDWHKGARSLNATSAAKYARDVAGPRLAEEIMKTSGDLGHIHLIGHSSGCWAISEAAKILAKETKADLHLTFLDAYVSVFWKESSLGDVNAAADVNCWVEHYYTRDYTLGWTQYDLSKAHNVDVTDIDQNLKDHNFPWKWYYATITGRYPKGYFLDDEKMVESADGVEYGFARSREVSVEGWGESLKLAVGNKAVKMKKKARR